MMKKALFPLLLSLLLLCGCARQTPPAENLPEPAASDAAPVRQALSTTPLPEAPPAVKGSILSPAVTGFLPLGGNLLFFSEEAPTLLTLFSPESGEALGVYEAPVNLTGENPPLRLLDHGIAYYNDISRETVVLDTALREIRRIADPEALTGTPLLSRDGSLLYYCTPDAVRCLDLGSGISRVLKEASYPVQSVAALLLEDSVIQLSITDSDDAQRTLFLSAENGQLLGDYAGTLLPETIGQTFLLPPSEENGSTLLFGDAAASPMVLHTQSKAEACFFLDGQLVTAAQAGTGIRLDLYHLDSGARTACVTGDFGSLPRSMTLSEDGTIRFLCQQEDGTSVLYHWDPSASQTGDPTSYAAPYFTREDPDYEGLAACSLYAREIGSRYGIDVLVYKDAVAVEPWDYQLEYAYQASVLQRELEALDARLSRFPEGFLSTLAGRFTALKICIVRSAVGADGSGSLSAVNGLQFWDGYDAYIVLAADRDTEYALYHELSHLLETVVLTESTAYDQWELLNPSGFQYDYDYITNLSRDGSPWLQEGNACFIDTYSMSFPKEDRARILEYAMTAGHEALFQSPCLQAKLQRICTGIRESFDLEDYPDPLPWEQYLLS